MRLLVGSVIALFVLWGGYWFIGSAAVESNAEKLMAQAREDGYHIDYTSLNTRGFPSRFDTTLEGIEFATPDARLRWSAPFFQLFALSYRPNHVIAIWPNEQTLTANGVDYTITGERQRASIVFEPNTTLALDRFQLSGENLHVATNGAGNFSAQSISLATEQVEETLNHHFGIRINGIEVTPPKAEQREITELYVDATVGLDAPISYATRAQPTRLDLHRAEIQIKDSTLSLEGILEIDTLGYATGTLSLTAHNWRPVYDTIKELSWIDPGFEPALADILTNLAKAESPEEDFTAPLIVSQGTIKFGFITIGYLPPLRPYLQ